MSAAESLSRVLAACETNRERDLAGLLWLLRQPSISTHDAGVTECAELVRQSVTAAGAGGTPFAWGRVSPASGPVFSSMQKERPNSWQSFIIAVSRPRAGGYC